MGKFKQGCSLAALELSQDVQPVPVMPTLACALFCLAVVYRLGKSEHANRVLQQRARKRIRESDALTDNFLQGVQGLLLSFHVAAQNCAAEAVPMQTLEHELCKADEFLLNCRERFERVSFTAPTDWQEEPSRR